VLPMFLFLPEPARIHAMNFRFFAIATCAALSVATSAAAQTPAPTPAAPQAAAAPTVPKHTCTKPDMPGPARTTTELQMKRFVDELNKYKACLQAYAASQQKLAEAAVAAGNAAIIEYNAFVEAASKSTNSADNKSEGNNNK
jgi:hypothetical protein